MARQDTSDFLTAFAVGTVLGIGATLLLRPEPRSPRERLMRELKPYRKKLRRSAARVGREIRLTAATALLRVDVREAKATVPLFFAELKKTSELASTSHTASGFHGGAYMDR